MSSYYIVILIIGSLTLYSKLSQLMRSIKAGNKKQISIDVVFLLITLLVIAGLIVLKKFWF